MLAIYSEQAYSNLTWDQLYEKNKTFFESTLFKCIPWTYGINLSWPQFMQQTRKKNYQGICLAIIRPETIPGKISVRATVEGLKEASLVIIGK